MDGFHVSLTINGVSDLLSRLSDVGANVEDAKNDAVDQVAQQLQQTIQMFAQGGHPSNPEVQTGDLMNSITWIHTGDGSASVYTDNPYSFFVEFGHANIVGRYVPAIGKRIVNPFTPAYPFFRPGITQVFDGGEASSIVQDVLSNAIGS